MKQSNLLKQRPIPPAPELDPQLRVMWTNIRLGYKASTVSTSTNNSTKTYSRADNPESPKPETVYYHPPPRSTVESSVFTDTVKRSTYYEDRNQTNRKLEKYSTSSEYNYYTSEPQIRSSAIIRTEQKPKAFEVIMKYNLGQNVRHERRDSAERRRRAICESCGRLIEKSYLPCQSCGQRKGLAMMQAQTGRKELLSRRSVERLARY